MNWDALGAIAELMGAGAVVVSLLYLATQVREGAREARRDATRELAARVSDVSLAVATNPELGQLLVEGAADLSRLSPGDQARFRGLMNALFRGLEQQFLLRTEGALDDESWIAVEHITRDFASLPGVQTYLTDRGRWYTTSFLEYVWSLVGGQPTGRARSLVEHVTEPTNWPGGAAES